MTSYLCEGSVGEASRIQCTQKRHGHYRRALGAAADQVPDQENHQRRVEQYRRAGTPGYRKNVLEKISQLIQFSDSSLVGGLQIADLTAYVHRRRAVVTEGDPRALRMQEEIWQVIAPRVVHEHEWHP